MSREPTLVRDLFDTLPPWGEFDLRPSWQGSTFVLDVGYEVEGVDAIQTISLKFAHTKVMLNSRFPTPPVFVVPVPRVTIERGQLFDVGQSELLTQVSEAKQFPELDAPLRHYYVYFTDMWKAFQVVSVAVEIN